MQVSRDQFIDLVGCLTRGEKTPSPLSDGDGGHAAELNDGVDAGNHGNGGLLNSRGKGRKGKGKGRGKGKDRHSPGLLGTATHTSKSLEVLSAAQLTQQQSWDWDSYYAGSPPSPQAMHMLSPSSVVSTLTPTIAQIGTGTSPMGQGRCSPFTVVSVHSDSGGEGLDDSAISGQQWLSRLDSPSEGLLTGQPEQVKQLRCTLLDLLAERERLKRHTSDLERQAKTQNLRIAEFVAEASRAAEAFEVELEESQQKSSTLTAQVKLLTKTSERDLRLKIDEVQLLADKVQQLESTRSRLSTKVTNALCLSSYLSSATPIHTATNAGCFWYARGGFVCPLLGVVSRWATLLSRSKVARPSPPPRSPNTLYARVHMHHHRRRHYHRTGV